MSSLAWCSSSPRSSSKGCVSTPLRCAFCVLSRATVCHTASLRAFSSTLARSLRSRSACAWATLVWAAATASSQRCSWLDMSDICLRMRSGSLPGKTAGTADASAESRAGGGSGATGGAGQAVAEEAAAVATGAAGAPVPAGALVSAGPLSASVPTSNTSAPSSSSVETSLPAPRYCSMSSPASDPLEPWSCGVSAPGSATVAAFTACGSAQLSKSLGDGSAASDCATLSSMERRCTTLEGDGVNGGDACARLGVPIAI